MNVLFSSLDETLDLHRLLDDEGWRLQELGPGCYRGRQPANVEIGRGKLKFAQFTRIRCGAIDDHSASKVL